MNSGSYHTMFDDVEGEVCIVCTRRNPHSQICQGDNTKMIETCSAQGYCTVLYHVKPLGAALIRNSSFQPWSMSSNQIEVSTL